MRISHIKISNILGHELLELNPAGITTISGPNGSGKSSVIAAIQAALGGTKKAQQAQLLRKGATEGEIVLVLDDGLKVTRRLDNEGKNTLSVYDPATKGRYTQGYLDQLVDALAVNPVAFLTASEKERAALMLEAIPMELGRADLDEALGGLKLRATPEKAHALVVLDAAEKELRSGRQELNRDAADRRKTVKTLEETLPPAPAGTDWAEAVAELEAKRDTLKAELGAAERDAQAHTAAAKAQHAEDYRGALARAAAKRDEAVEAANRAIAAAREEYAQVERRCVEFRAKLDGEADQKAQTELAGTRERINQGLIDVSAMLADAKAQAEESIRAGTTRKLIDEKKAEAEEAEMQAERRTLALERLEGLKRKLTSNLPIAGLEVQGGAITVDGVPFETLNTAKKVKVAFEIAALRAKDLGFICCDGLEVLDAESLAAFYEAAEASGLQLIVTRVSDEPFTIETR